MKITKFEIKNFKGIVKTSLGIADEIPGNVCTLIGLNESNKTTILEAISNFGTEDRDTASLVQTVQPKVSTQDMIPKDRKAAFSDQISIEATVVLDDSDVAALSKALWDNEQLLLNDTGLLRSFTVKQTFEFKDSKYENRKRSWSINFGVKKSRDRKYRHIGGSKKEGEEFKLWLFLTEVLHKQLPKVIYFPTFLFNFPDRIYLDGDNGETNAYYVQVIQDVLDSQGEGLEVKRHIVDRITSLRSEHPAVATFMAFFFARDEKKQIDAVLQRASNKMSQVIFGAWNEILGRSVTGKRVQIDWLLDAEKGNSPYLELSIVDGQSKYSLSERSLGFRWFFSFLLFTQFRRNRKEDGSTIFLFDEPAANLHSKAQMKLLESFSRIVDKDTYIVYSTHSHYMVNPLWLEKAYIVENKATNYDSEDDIDSFAVRKTDVSAIRYRTFVASNPSRTTYFQPVLDALQIPISPLVRSSRAVMIEGKYDYHPLLYFCRRLSRASEIELFPGSGAGHFGALISLFRGWGVAFTIILDDDRAGRSAKKKYLDNYLLGANEVKTLADIDAGFAGKQFEDLYTDDVVSAACSHFGISKLDKRQYSLFFQDLVAGRKDVSFPVTELVFEKLLIQVEKIVNEIANSRQVT